jgi:hypothetical protein
MGKIVTNFVVYSNAEIGNNKIRGGVRSLIRMRSNNVASMHLGKTGSN